MKRAFVIIVAIALCLSAGVTERPQSEPTRTEAIKQIDKEIDFDNVEAVYFYGDGIEIVTEDAVYWYHNGKIVQE